MRLLPLLPALLLAACGSSSPPAGTTPPVTPPATAGKVVRFVALGDPGSGTWEG